MVRVAIANRFLEVKESKSHPAARRRLCPLPKRGVMIGGVGTKEGGMKKGGPRQEKKGDGTLHNITSSTCSRLKT